jgi:hypothetical protein
MSLQRAAAPGQRRNLGAAVGDRERAARREQAARRFHPFVQRASRHHPVRSGLFDCGPRARQITSGLPAVLDRRVGSLESAQGLLVTALRDGNEQTVDDRQGGDSAGHGT